MPLDHIYLYSPSLGTTLHVISWYICVSLWSFSSIMSNFIFWILFVWVLNLNFSILFQYFLINSNRLIFMLYFNMFLFEYIKTHVLYLLITYHISLINLKLLPIHSWHFLMYWRDIFLQIALVCWNLSIGILCGLCLECLSLKSICKLVLLGTQGLLFIWWLSFSLTFLLYKSWPLWKIDCE